MSKKILNWFVLYLLGLAFAALPAGGQVDFQAFSYGSEDSCAYYQEGKMPVYRRSLPIASDDPMRFFMEDDTLIPYEYGYVFITSGYDW